MQTDNLQLQRFELKYVVSEQTALRARDFVRAYLKLDPFCEGKTDLSYPIHSIYVDTSDLQFYRQTINGNKNRHKLRIRFYNDDPSAPAFLEIKRRTDNAILKQRCPVAKTAVAEILQGRMPGDHAILSRNPRHLSALHRFLQLACEQQLQPKAHVSYLREAWLSPHDNSVRVTVDRDVRFEADSSGNLFTQMRSPLLVFGSQPVLEIKFTGLFPSWLGEMVRSLGLSQGPAAKYADGVTLLGENKLRQICGLAGAGIALLRERKEIA